MQVADVYKMRIKHYQSTQSWIFSLEFVLLVQNLYVEF